MHAVARHTKSVPGEEDGLATTTINNHKKNVKSINETKPQIDVCLEGFQITTQEHLAAARKNRLTEF